MTRGYEDRLSRPQQACSTSRWTQSVGSASAAVITATSRRDASSAPPSSSITSRVGIHQWARASLRARPRWTPRRGCPGARHRSKSGRELAPEGLVVAANRPPVAVSPHPLVDVVRRVRRIHRSAGRCPVGVLVEEPAAGAQARCHLPDRLFLPSLEMEQHQPRADEVERTRVERVQRVLEDVVLDNLEVRELEPRQVPGVDVGRHDVAGRADLRGQPHGHGATPRSDLETSPARLDQRPSLVRDRIVDLLEEVQPAHPLLPRGLPRQAGSRDALWTHPNASDPATART